MSNEELSLKILSWNIALGGPSINSPDDWDTEQNLYKILDIIEDHNPDVITLQEMPDSNFGYHLSNEFDYITPIKTHSGYTGIFVNRSIDIKGYVEEQPALGVEVLSDDVMFRIFGCHLFPFKKNRKYRIAFLQQLINTYRKVSMPFIVAGDLNMRMDETSAIVDSVNVKDAYLESDKDPDKRFTWDSTLNIFSHGPKFKCRFDRIFFSNLELRSFDLIGTTPINDVYYLSDHFGIVSEFQFTNFRD